MTLWQSLQHGQSTGRAIGLMVFGVLLFTAMDALAKNLLTHYPAQQVIWARFAGQLAFVMLILRKRFAVIVQTTNLGLHFARSACQLGATGLFFLSLGHIGLAEATALIDLNPLLITLGAALFLGEKLGVRRVLAVLAAMAGAMIIIRPGLGVFTLAALLPIGASVCYAANALITRFIGTSESPWTSMVYTSLLCTLALTPLLPFGWQTINAGHIGLFVLMGALGTAAQLCVIASFATAHAAVVAPFGYLGVVFATFWGITLFREYPDQWTILGALVIVMSGLYVWHRETRAARNTP